VLDLAVAVDISGALAAVDDIEGRAGDLTPVWRGPVDRALRQMFAEVWETQGASIGAPWAPLAPLTLALKARANRAGMGPLKFSQALYRSFTVRSSPDGVRDVTPTSLTFGSRNPVAALMQQGWETTTIFGRPRRVSGDSPAASTVGSRLTGGLRRVPARQIVPDEPPASTLDTIYGAVIDYIVEGKV
jgi:hypothetical protein